MRMLWHVACSESPTHKLRLGGAMIHMRRLALAFALLFALVLPALAQIEAGSISGTVKDEQGGILPGVTVTLQGVDATQTAVSDSAGLFRFLNLAPGPYKISATLQGFANVEQNNVIVSVGRNVDLPMTMKVAGVSETVNVTGESPIIDTKQTGTATNITSDEL